MSSIIVFFSRPGNNYVNGTIKNLPIGNTEVAAEILQELTGAEMFKIDPIVPYSLDYSECIEEAKQDYKRNARPELKKYLSSIEEYDTIYLGYPNYWGTMPMAVFTFLEKYDFSGKIIRPFCTHEGSGMGISVSDIKKICNTAIIEPGIPIIGARVKDSRNNIEQWIK